MTLLAQLKAQLANLPPPDPRQPNTAPEQQERLGKAPPAGAPAGRDRAAHQRRKRPPQEALHQPATREAVYAVYYDALRRAIEDRGTENFPEVNGKKLYGELTMIVTVNYDGRVLATDVVGKLRHTRAGPPRRADRPRGPARLAASTMPCASGPTRSWWCRASSSRATRRWKPG